MLLTEFDEEREWKLIAEGFREIGFDEGIKEGIEKGVEKGIEKGKKGIIKNMLSNGFTKEKILQLTGISNEEYDKLIN